MTQRPPTNALLRELQARFDVTRLVADGVSVWPVIRALTYAPLLYPERPRTAWADPEPGDPASPSNRILAASGMDELNELAQSARKRLDGQIARAGRLLDGALGLFVEPDPASRLNAPAHLAHALADGQRAVAFALDAGDGGDGGPHSPLSLDPQAAHLVRLARMKAHDLAGEDAIQDFGGYWRAMLRRHAVAGLDEYNEVLSGLSGLRIEPGRAVSQILQVRAREELFSAVLAAGRPAAVLLSCCYRAEGFGLALACSRAGVPCADVQHGFMANFHGFYPDWDGEPDGGYDMLPGWMWMWTDTHCRAMERLGPRRSLRPVCGGDPRGLAPQAEAALPPELARRMNAASASVLLALQPREPVVPHEVRRAVADAPDDWLWLVRLHPRMAARRDELAALLHELAPGRFELDLATAADLPALLRASAVVMTRSSTVAYDAWRAGIPFIVTDEPAAATYAGFMEGGRGALAATAPEMLAAIRNMADSALFPGQDREGQHRLAQGALAAICGQLG